MYSSYLDSQTAFIYKSIIEDVIRTVRKEKREEVDDTTLMFLRKNWEKKINDVVNKFKDPQKQTTQPSDQPGADFRLAAPIHVQKPTQSSQAPNIIEVPEVYGIRTHTDDKLPRQPITVFGNLNPSLAVRPQPRMERTLAQPVKPDMSAKSLVPEMSIRHPHNLDTNTRLPNKQDLSIQAIRHDAAKNMPKAAGLAVKGRANLPPLVLSEKRKNIEQEVSLLKTDVSTNTADVGSVPSKDPPKAGCPPSKRPKVNRIVQLDGGGSLTDSSDITGSDSENETSTIYKEQNVKLSDEFGEVDNQGNIIYLNEMIRDEVSGPQELPPDYQLLSGDDVSENEPDAYTTDNIVICGFDKLSKRKNIWKLELKNGVISLGGLDIIFNKATGEFVF
ncbi:TFIIA-alpha and beta-like factor [Thelohanellus kitauei]|uniref:TFIIA-alpha and beta-like factor n=1 Tax=Thelohanellus kitauei TaxID=669202 RepID=A0A0C2N177_THEKT|nr:TFIIA-alpha and beta-like factor [Thelohanellus kitauei]